MSGRGRASGRGGDDGGRATAARFGGRSSGSGGRSIIGRSNAGRNPYPQQGRHPPPSRNAQQQQQQQHHHPPPPQRDGEKGASAHTVSEEYRIQLTRVLMALRETSDDTTTNVDDATTNSQSITLPNDLTNTQRKFVHELAKQLGLKSKSYGKGDDRKVVVSKVLCSRSGGIGGILGGTVAVNGGSTSSSSSSSSSSLTLPTEAQYKQVPRINVGRKGEEALYKHITKYPPSMKEDAESRETGSSMLSQHPAAVLDLVQSSKVATTTNCSRQTHNNQQCYQQKQKHHPPKTQHQYNKMIQQRKQSHEQLQQKMISQSQYKQMIKQRSNLPAYAYANDVCNVLRNTSNQVVILTGDTGCGKSTQVPQFILDDKTIGPTANIIVTQPRRISAISVAERVASERCEIIGCTVGYSVRLENCNSSQTQLLFCTPGVLMKRLHPSGKSDVVEDRNVTATTTTTMARLAEYTHIIMDEIHERDKNTEFLMIALQDLLEVREDLKLILMSATMPTRELAEYWCGVGRRRQAKKPEEYTKMKKMSDEDCGVDGIVTTGFAPAGSAVAMPIEINIPGRTFPVQEFFLEDVLLMTGVSMAHPDEPDMDQIDSDLLSLLCSKRNNNNNNNSSNNNNNKNSVGNGKKSNNAGRSPPQSLLLWEESTSLTCVMCNRSGFKCAEEFGTHIALCDGGGKGELVSMLELEDKVRSMDVSSANVGGFDLSDVTSSIPDGEDLVNGKSARVDIMEDEMEDYDDDDDDVGCGLIGGKWDGQSPFGTDTAVPTKNKPTLTEDELLTRYQTMYDDEEINYDLTLALVRYVNQSSYGDGAILIFFSGWADISEFLMILESTPPFNNRSQFVLYPLHSGIPSKEQRQVFIKPPRGMRKIILATNIAETSLTIEDVAFVIDTGRSKEKSYDPHLKTSTLQESWISQASAKQRKGRAGRCKAGVCFHLFSRRRHASMRPFVESELIRTPLEEICLQCKQLKLAPGGPDEPNGIPAFLSKAMTPPHTKSVMNALELLCALGAMDEETNELSNLGSCLSALSLEPRVGKMVIMSYLIGCAKASSSMSVAMSHKSLFSIPPPSMRKASDMSRVKLSEYSNSDQITSLNVLRNRDIVAKRGMGHLAGWCRQNYLNYSSVTMVSQLRTVVSRELEGLGFPPCSTTGYHNRFGDTNPAILQASICAGLYPNVAFRCNGDVNFSTLTNRKAKIHLGSVNAVKSQPLSNKCQVADNQVEFVIFGEMVKGKAMFTMENTTHLVSPLPLLLLSGRLHVKQIQLAQPTNSNSNDNSTSVGVVVPIQKSILSLDDWLVFLCESNVAAALVVLRQRLDSAFSRLTTNPSNYLSELSAAEKDAIETLSQVLSSSHNAALGIK